MSKTQGKAIIARDQLVMEIRAGQLLHGSPFPSRKEICERFSVSPMTAHKVQQALLEMGLIQERRGASFVVTSDRVPAMDLPVKLRRVCSIFPPSRGKNTSRWMETIEGCREACAERGLEFRSEIDDSFYRNENYINTARTAAPDEGYIINLSARTTLREVLGLLLSPRTRIVLVNAVFPGRPSVLTDNRHGIGELLQCAKRHGAKRVMLAGCFALSFPIVNESERMEAFQDLAPEMGLEQETDRSGDYQTIAEHVRAFRPDVLFFTRDDMALHFRTDYLPQLPEPPRCFGFDDIVEQYLDHRPLTTYHVDCRGIGRRAVELLFEPCSEYTAPLYSRVRGELRDREG